ncbi:MAG: YegP family protein [Bacteroidales bacterium]|nr:YegP family protein [Bacteroidales bacterium]
MGKFEITSRKNGEFQFNLKATNGQVILTSQGYKTKASCLNGVESVKKNSQDDKRFEVKVSSNGKPFFNLMATNDQVIGTSQMYASETTMKNGIASVKRNAPEAAIVDLTEA